MDSTLICRTHTTHYITHIDLYPFSTGTVLMCPQCIKEDLVLYQTHKAYIQPVKKFLRDSATLVDGIAGAKDVGVEAFKRKADQYLKDFHQILARENMLIKSDFQEVERTLDDIIRQCKEAKNLLHNKLEACYEDAHSLVTTMVENRERAQTELLQQQQWFRDISQKLHSNQMHDLEAQELLLELKSIFYEENRTEMLKMSALKQPQAQDILINRLCAKYFVRPRYLHHSPEQVAMKDFLQGLQSQRHFTPQNVFKMLGLERTMETEQIINEKISTAQIDHKNGFGKVKAYSSFLGLTEVKSQQRVVTRTTRGVRTLKVIDQDTIAVGGDDRKVEIWNYNSRELEQTLRCHSWPYCFEVAHKLDSMFLLAGTSAGEIETFYWQEVSESPKNSDKPQFVAKQRLKVHEGCVNRVQCISPGSGVVISGGHDGQIVLTDISALNGRCLYRFNNHHVGHVLSIEVITTGNYFATGGNDGRLNVFKMGFDANTKRHKFANITSCQHYHQICYEDTSPVSCIQSVEQYPELLVVAVNKTIHVVQWEKNIELMTMGPHESIIYSMTVVNRIERTSDEKSLYQFKGIPHLQKLEKVNIVALTSDSQIHVWDPLSRQKLVSIGHNQKLCGFNPQGGVEVTNQGRSMNVFVSSVEHNYFDILQLM